MQSDNNCIKPPIKLKRILFRNSPTLRIHYQNKMGDKVKNRGIIKWQSATFLPELSDMFEKA